MQPLGTMYSAHKTLGIAKKANPHAYPKIPWYTRFSYRSITVAFEQWHVSFDKYHDSSLNMLYGYGNH